MYLIFDTETTGFPDKRLPPEHPAQARIVQFAALLLDENFQEIESFKHLIKPDGWTISPGAQAVHKITMEMCEKDGLPIKEVINKFIKLSDQSVFRIAHNLHFDKQMVEIELALLNSVAVFKITDICTMLATTPVCCLAGKFGKYKWPKLIEAYYILFKERFDYAHDAMADVRACARVFKWLVTNGKIKGISKEPVSAISHT